MPFDIDVDLITGAERDSEGIDRLITAVWPEAYRVAYGILRDRGLAEDAAQEACASMARSLHLLRNPAFFRSWMYRVVANQAVSAARRRRSTETLEFAATVHVSFDGTDALDLHEALGTLSVVQRATILLHYYAGLNSGEIAAATGHPASTIRFHLMLARRALRKALSPPDKNTHRPSEEIVTNGH